MARWIPPGNIGPNEHLGRRLFDEPKLFGARDQKQFTGLEIRNFQETRDNEFSLDRLGGSGVIRKVVNYLVPRADATGRKFQNPLSFDGWMVVPARTIEAEGWPLVASPDQGSLVNGAPKPWNDAHLDQNLYHGHLVMPADIDRKLFPLVIREVFTGAGSQSHIRPGHPRLLAPANNQPTGGTTILVRCTNLLRDLKRRVGLG
jgi:hypothetical protein